MPLCCATLHVIVRSCTEEGPVQGAQVTISRIGEDLVEVVQAFTDDTGTITALVSDAGDYRVEVLYNSGRAFVDVEAVCGINEVTVQFGLTSKICPIVLDPDGAPVSGHVIEVTDEDDNVLGSCVAGGDGSCCIDIPGPGNYTLNGGEASTEVKEDDCGDRIVQFNVLAPAPSCDRHVNVNLCGCPAKGVTVQVTITGVGTYSGVTDASGNATITMTEPGCDAWIGSEYEIMGTTLTGTITSEPMNIVDNTPGAYWCIPGANPCFELIPVSIEAAFIAGFADTVVNGSSVTLTKTGSFTWESGCFEYTAGTFGTMARLIVTVDPNISGCEPNYLGTLSLRQYPKLTGGTTCSGSFSTTSYFLDNETASACPFYFLYDDAGSRFIEVTP